MLDDRQGSRVGGGEAAGGGGGGGSPRIALPFAGDVIQPPQVVATREASDDQEEWEWEGTNRARARLQKPAEFRGTNRAAHGRPRLAETWGSCGRPGLSAKAAVEAPATPGGSGGNHIWSKYSLAVTRRDRPAINSAGGGT